jgi:hypothetical protein
MSSMVFFTFPEDARWNRERIAVEFGVEIGEYRGVVRVPRRVLQQLLGDTPTPERCVEAYHLHRPRLELIVERKIRRRQLTDDGNVEITGRDLRERAAATAESRIGYWRVAPWGRSRRPSECRTAVSRQDQDRHSARRTPRSTNPRFPPGLRTRRIRGGSDQVVHFAVEMATTGDALPARGQVMLPRRYSVPGIARAPRIRGFRRA